jgi:3-oxoacyl-[acyl-carrier-protein] synthase II
MVQHGDAVACVAGGSEAAITDLAMAAFAEMGATSPTGISRPFDRRRDGFVMGEGAGVMVLEDAETAELRGAEILGYLTGYGATADAHHMTAPEPTGDGAARAIRKALADAEIEPGQLAYVNAHGTSTPLNDRSETEALKTALGEQAGRIPTSSTKSSIGHLLGAAGAVEGVATLQALRAKTAPPTLNYEEPDEGLDLDYVTSGSRELDVNGHPAIGISNSFGFGGHNVVLVMEAPV